MDNTACSRIKGLRAETIQTFLSTFVGNDNDITRAIGDVDIADDSDSSPRDKGLTYMQQLVRRSTRFFDYFAHDVPATDSQS